MHASCGLFILSQAARPAAAGLANTVADAPVLPSRDPRPGHGDYTAWMLATVDPHTVYAALDAGCGDGTRTAALRERLAPHALVTALDLDRDAVRATGSFGGVDAVRADISRLPHPDGSFDLIVAGHVLYYPSDLTGWLWEIRRVMSRSGMLLAATNSAQSGRRLLDLHAAACRSAGQEAMAARALAPTARQRFTLENGADQLRRVFPDVTVRWRDDPLVFDSATQALAVYRAGLFTRGAPARMPQADRERLAVELAPHMRASLEAAADAQGRIVIPRRSGCFTARG